MARKKSYNPFKMWGSYVGALIFSFFIVFYGFAFPTSKFISDYFEIFFGTGVSPNIIVSIILIIIPFFIIGFLVGWGIHSIFRALKK